MRLEQRLEVIESGGWLSQGHGLDLTFLATAADLETQANGATHMGNDDITTFDAVGQLKIIDVSCPQQMLSIMKWIMDGNRGLNYVRVMRTPSAVLYGPDYTFEFGRGHVVKETPHDTVAITCADALPEADITPCAQHVDLLLPRQQLLELGGEQGEPFLDRLERQRAPRITAADADCPGWLYEQRRTDAPPLYRYERKPRCVPAILAPL